jgi:GTP:adenosylcobinamide-phosphate guanylyltransferase
MERMLAAILAGGKGTRMDGFLSGAVEAGITVCREV